MPDILCINTSALPVDDKAVCRKVDLDWLLSDECLKAFPTPENIEPPYVPLTIAVSVRSCYDNTCLVMNRDNKEYFFHAVTNFENFPHRGMDLMSYLSSLSFLDFIEYGEAVGNIMQYHSDCVPIGFYNPNPKWLRPILYTHIVLSDWGMYLLTKHYLQDNVTVVPIEDLKERWKNAAYFPMLDTLLTVKREKLTMVDDAAKAENNKFYVEETKYGE